MVDAGLAEVCRETLAGGGLLIPENTVKEWLRDRGVSVPPGRVADTLEMAIEFARKVSYPVVMKLVSDRMLHKTEVRGVVVGIEDESALRRAYHRLEDAADMIPGAPEIYVELQVPPGPEVIVGLQNDEHFGPVLMVGTGGTYTDLLKDVAFRTLPVTETEVLQMLEGLQGWQLLKGFRGAPASNVDSLVKLVTGIAKLGVEIAPFLDSADFNPVIALPGGAWIVDAKITLAREELPDPFAFERPRTDHLGGFFDPASVAVVGASASPGKIGNVVVDSLVNHEFKGKVFPVNPGREEIMGVKCYPSLEALPERPDLVVMVVDLAEGPELLERMASLEIHNLLVISGGGKERGGDREKVEEEMAALARERDVRIVGPNCIGAFDGETRFDSFFYSHERVARPPAGKMACITQSGTWGCAFLEWARTTGGSKMVSYGNRVDVDEGDLIAYLSGDPSTSVIGSYVEGLSGGRKFLAAAKGAAKNGKPVVVFKTGRNERSAEAAVSHTGAYGGSYEVYAGALEQAGIITTDSFHELFGACKALAMQPAAAGPRAAMLSNGAGPMVNALDLFPVRGLELVTLEGESVTKMRDHFSFFYLVENPVDVTGSASAEDYEFVIRTLLADEKVDIIMPFFVFQDTPLDESIVERMELLAGSDKPILGCAIGGDYSRRMSARLEAVGIPVMDDVTQWVAAAAALARWGKVKPKK